MVTFTEKKSNVTFTEKKEDDEISNNEDSKEFGEKKFKGKNIWEITDEKDFIGLEHTVTLKDKKEQLKRMKKIWEGKS